MDNGLPIHFKYMNGKTPIYIEFTDIIQDRYLVDVEWFPNWGLAPLLTGPANINFRVKDANIKLQSNLNYSILHRESLAFQIIE